MHDDGTTSQDRPREGAPRPVERWRPRPVRDLDDLVDDLLDDLVATSARTRSRAPGHRGSR